jgi:hypothetical protein
MMMVMIFLLGFYFIAKLSRWAAGGSSNSSRKSSPLTDQEKISFVNVLTHSSSSSSSSYGNSRGGPSMPITTTLGGYSGAGAARLNVKLW